MFRKRLKQDFQRQLKVVRTVIDWTTIVYLILPLLAVFMLDVWVRPGQYWSEDIPFYVVSLLILLFCSSGSIRTYLYEADVLFLLQRPDLIKRFRLYSFGLSVVKSAMHIIMIILLFLPVLLVIYELKVMDFIFLMLLLIGYKTTILFIRKRFNHLVVSVLMSLVVLSLVGMILTFISPVVYAGIGVVLTFITGYLFMKMDYKRRLLKDIEMENHLRNRLVNLIFHMSNDVEVDMRTKPMKRVRLRSRRLFKKRTEENVLLEMLIKSVIRHYKYIGSYLQIMLVTLFVIIIVPSYWFVAIIYISFIAFIHSWFNSVYDQLVSSDFFTVVPYSYTKTIFARKRFKRWMTLPSIILVTLVLTFKIWL
ncbi:ABC transporter permease [Alkalibacillus haloalkaliphilus]|uniref:ABC transporter permease n=1 Tax=Alkalibacillus haloalkaliphilus TaxID=94136 RepID=UPI002935B237|nr:ABC transporter permease [Alkalibacillus haloalkaliphilus]MDV2581766.1 ABC transporter permease [Alkalibacillus haloalkaliphilus]